MAEAVAGGFRNDVARKAGAAEWPLPGSIRWSHSGHPPTPIIALPLLRAHLTWMISGARYSGVPHTVKVFSDPTRLANPKSAILTCPAAEKSKFSGCGRGREGRGRGGRGSGGASEGRGREPRAGKAERGSGASPADRGSAHPSGDAGSRTRPAARVGGRLAAGASP